MQKHHSDNIVEKNRPREAQCEGEALDIYRLIGFTKHAVDPRLEPG